MDVVEIRLKNYKELLRRFRLRADQSGLPEYGMLRRFSEHSGVSARYLSHINNGRKNIGPDVARVLESAFELPHGWMDNDHDNVPEAHTDDERKFLAVALQLFRESPIDAQHMLMRYMLEQRDGAVKAVTPKPTRPEGANGN